MLGRAPSPENEQAYSGDFFRFAVTVQAFAYASSIQPFIRGYWAMIHHTKRF